jgi:NarL family two-component system sensor histidine kinase LiaS
MVVGSKLLMEAMAAKLEATSQLEATSADSQREFQAIISLLQRAIYDTRQILLHFRPIDFAFKGSWVEALKAWLDFQPFGRTQLELDISEQVSSVPTEWHEVLYRVACEGLQNALAHSRATAIRFRADACAKRLELTIQDNGQGFDLAVIPEDHFGLRGMQERIADLGGILEVESMKGRGTRIKVSVPLPLEMDHS